MKKEILVLDDRGGVELPGWIVVALLKSAKVRSKRKRIVKKVVKKEFIRLLIKSAKDVYEQNKTTVD
jgi:hypothetical protein